MSARPEKKKSEKKSEKSEKRNLDPDEIYPR